MKPRVIKFPKQVKKPKIDTPDNHKKVKATIRRYERNLEQEKQKFGAIHDGGGMRYRLAPLYLRIGDVQGALKSYQWFQKNFPDDAGEPFLYLCWALTLYKTGKLDDVRKKLIETIFQNIYVLPRLLGLQLPPTNLDCSSNWEYLDYVDDGKDEYFDLWNKDSIEWAQKLYYEVDVQAMIKRYIEIKQELAHLDRGTRRSELFDEIKRLKNKDMKS